MVRGREHIPFGLKSSEEGANKLRSQVLPSNLMQLVFSRKVFTGVL